MKTTTPAAIIEAATATAEETRDNARFYERIRTANAAAVSLLDAYADAIGEYPAEEDPETVAAYRAAHDEIIGSTHRTTAADRATVESMIDAIAEHHRRQTAYVHAHGLSRYASNPYIVWDTESVTRPRVIWETAHDLTTA